MTPQEIISQIRRLPPDQQKEVRDSFDENDAPVAMTDREFLEMLHAKGIIGNIPDPTAYSDEDDDFEPIEIKGEPLSEMIIRERR